MNDSPITVMHRPISDEELTFIQDSGNREFPSPNAPARFLYVVNSEAHARRWARYLGQRAIASFNVHSDYVTQHPERLMRKGETITVLWIPKNEIDDFNMHLVGDIEVKELKS